MKLKISYTPTSEAFNAPKVCSACNGSGYYDDFDVKRNRQPKCGACDGYGDDRNERKEEK